MNYQFQGFYEQTVDFLFGLRIHNNKAWFEEHRGDYQKYLLEPFKSLVIDLAPVMQEIDPWLEVTPDVNKTISRIYRDTRFSKDKSPFRDHLWLTFKRKRPDWQDAPAYFFELTPESYRYGMGYYLASTETMEIFRKKLIEKPGQFLELTRFLYNNSEFAVEGEKYKKPKVLHENQAITDWCGWKYFFIVINRTIDDQLFETSLVQNIDLGFRQLSPLYHFLWQLKK